MSETMDEKASSTNENISGKELEESGLYDDWYYQHCCGAPYRRDQHWLKFFNGIAERIIDEINPASLLDAGCAMGILVETLRDCGVEAYGFDISEFALKQAREDIKAYVWAGSILDPLPRRYDLIVCIEVLEHLSPEDCEKAIENLCKASDDILFSSTPYDYTEPTHINVQEPEYWASLFAKQGFWHDLDFDASFATPWTIRFRKIPQNSSEVVLHYERKLWRNTKQLVELRKLAKETREALTQRQQLETQRQQLEAEKQAQKQQIESAQIKISQIDQELQRHKQLSLQYQRERNHVQIEYDKAVNEIKELKWQIKQLGNNKQVLDQTLARVETELMALKATRTVRYSRAVGLFANASRQLVSDLRSGPILGSIDTPVSNSSVSKELTISGWAVSSNALIQQIEVFLDNVSLGFVPYGLERQDVLAIRPLQVTAHCGYAGEFKLDAGKFEAGPKQLTIHITDNKGHQIEFSQTVLFTPPVEEEKLEFGGLSFYEQWIADNEPSASELQHQKEQAQQLNYRPLISILTPVYNPPVKVLKAMMESVISQTYDYWELCLVDGGSTDPAIHRILREFASRDERVRIKFLDKNLGIAGNSNEALNMVNGEFIALLDHDDELAPFALYENVLLLNSSPEADMIYSDEDKVDAIGNRRDPFFKPDWSPDLFRSQMYTCHLGVYRAGLIKAIGGFHSGFEGAQDYDLVLRLVEHTSKIYHIPRILYHWRMLEGSTASSMNNKDYAQNSQLKAVTQHCQRLGLDAVVELGLVPHTLRVKYQLKSEPLVSIIIPTRDQAMLLKQCIDSIQLLTTYPNYEIIIVNNGSQEQATFDYFEALSIHPNIRIIEYAGEFNFSAINNVAALEANGEILLFLNNDIEVTTPGWLEAMLEHVQRPEVGAVGARLLYPDGTLQHGGVIIGVGSVAGHAQKRLGKDEAGYFSRAKVIQNFSAVTAACLMVRAETFRELRGFNEDNLPVAFNDVDFCLRVRERDLLIVWTPFAELIHNESVSRGHDNTPEKVARFRREMQYMRRRWSHVIQNDPYYNPNLSLEVEDFSIAPFSRYCS